MSLDYIVSLRTGFYSSEKVFIFKSYIFRRVIPGKINIVKINSLWTKIMPSE